MTTTVFIIHETLLCFLSSIKFQNFRTPENFAVIYLKFKQREGYFVKSLGYFFEKMHME